MSFSNIVYIDVETNGYRGLEILSKMNRIIQLGAIYNGKEYETLVNPGVPISHLSTKFHGISDSMVASCPSFDIIWNEFVNNFLDPNVPVYYLVAHGGDFFDRIMIVKELHRLGAVFDTNRFKFIDTDPIFRQVAPNAQSHNLGAMIRQYLPDYEFKGEHTALADCRALQALVEYFKPVLARVQRTDFKMIYELDQHKWLLKEHMGFENTIDLANNMPSFIVYRWIKQNVPGITEEKINMALLRIYNYDIDTLKKFIL